MNQYVNNLIALQTSGLAESSKLSIAKRHEMWNHLVCLYGPVEEKSKLISILYNSCYNPQCDVHYLKSCAEFFREKDVDKLFEILDRYFSYYLNNESACAFPLDLASTILNNVISEIERTKADLFESSVVLLYKYSLETASQICKSNEDSLYEPLATLNHKLSLLFKMQGKSDQSSSNLRSKVIYSILNHICRIQTKYVCTFRKSATIQITLELYQNLFKLVDVVQLEPCNVKNGNLMVFQCWYACVSFIIENLNLDHLHEKFAQALDVANDFTTNMLLRSYRKTDASSSNDRINFRSFVSTVGKLSLLVSKLDSQNSNKALNAVLIRPVLRFFLAVPEQLVVSMHDVSITCVYFYDYINILYKDYIRAFIV